MKVPTTYLVLRIVKALPFIHQPDRVAPKAPKASDVSPAGWLYQLMWKKIRYFLACVAWPRQGVVPLRRTLLDLAKSIYYN